MRIIGGEFGGRKLAPIGRGNHIRPTADRIKESVFSIIDGHILNARVLDLFSGTGALGLEALSRGAASAVFIDRDKRALSLISQNIQVLGVAETTRLIGWDIAKNLHCIRAPEADRSEGGVAAVIEPIPPRFDLVFADPPYDRQLVGTTLRHLTDSNALSANALIVLEHAPSEPAPRDLTGYRVADQRTYGRTAISFLKTNPI